MVQTISSAVTDNILGPLRKAGILQQDQFYKAHRVHLPSLTGRPVTRASNREAAGQFVETSTSAPTAVSGNCPAYSESIQLLALLHVYLPTGMIHVCNQMVHVLSTNL